MRRFVNQWSLLCAWAALMGAAWVALVPAFLSVSSLIVLTLSGPVFILAGSTVLGAHRQELSPGQARGEIEAAEAAGRGQR
jgi:hypothetical protein